MFNFIIDVLTALRWRVLLIYCLFVVCVVDRKFVHSLSHHYSCWAHKLKHHSHKTGWRKLSFQGLRARRLDLPSMLAEIFSPALWDTITPLLPEGVNLCLFTYERLSYTHTCTLTHAHTRSPSLCLSSLLCLIFWKWFFPLLRVKP